MRRMTDSRMLPPMPSILGKRKLGEAFGERIYDDQARYGQAIPPDYFVNHMGHNCYTKKIEWKLNK